LRDGARRMVAAGASPDGREVATGIVSPPLTGAGVGTPDREIVDHVNDLVDMVNYFAKRVCRLRSSPPRRRYLRGPPPLNRRPCRERSSAVR
jgi:hypothetical protein